MTSYQPIEGAGGGKGGGGSARTPREEPNTLRSTSKARIIDMIGEGPIVGLVNGLQSVFFDDTPLEDDDGNANFAGVTVHTRDGYPDQDHIAGFPSVENEVDVSVEVTQDVPITRAVDNLDADAVRVKIQIPQLSYQDLETGDLEGYRVAIAIDVRPNGGSWSERRADMIEGKTTSPYQRAYRIDLPGTGPWEVRVRRTSEDADKSNINNQTYWAAYTEIIDSKLIYPDSALVALEVDAQQFGSDIPSRAFDMKLRIVEVPSNYDPETRTYSGLWDGSFKLAWSDNPAWCFRDLAMSVRYGAGLENVDKWGLYAIAQYCDELVPNGYGQEEPRFTFNTLFASREEAITTLDTMASIFRGMTYWGTNTVMATADMPADPVKLVTPSNVIEDENSGCFTYSGSALKARHTVALVSWTDPENGYELSVEVVEDKDGIERYGWRQKGVTLVGCTSRGQARRAGLWILYSERAETETVSYKCSVDQADLRPGDIIALSDPSTAGARLGGRLRQTGLERLQLDQRPDEASGGDWYLDVKLPSGGIERRAVASFDGDFVILANPLSQTPVDGAVWMLSSTEVEPRLFRVLSNKEQEDHTYAITALEHDPNKYARIEQGLQLPEPDNTLIPTGPVMSPYNITIEPSTYIAGGTEHQKMTVSWTPSDDARVMSYMLDARGPADVKYSTRYVGEGTSFDLLDVAPGEWSVRVRGVTGTGTMSPWTVLTTQVTALLLPLPPTTIDLEVGTFSVVLKPQGGRPGQQFEFWRATAALDESMIESNAVKLGAGNQISDVDLSPDTTYYYYVRGRNVYGVSGWYPVQATTDNDPSAVLENISGEITESALYQGLNDRIDLIDSAATIAGSVNQRVQEEADARIDGLAAEADDRRADITAVENAYTSADESLSERIDTLTAAGDGYAAQIQQEQTARIDGDEALASDMTSLTSAVDANGADITTEREARVSADEAIASDVTSLYAATASNASLISSEQTARADGDSALSSRIDTLSSSVDGNSSDITIERQARIDGDGALASDITQLRTDVDDNVAAIQSEQTARADADSALASDINTVQVQLGKDIASVEEQAETLIDEQTGRINAMWTLRVDANGLVGGMGLANDGEQVDVIYRTDRFSIAPPGLPENEVIPFIVEGSTTYLKEALIQSLTFTKLRASDGSLIFQDGKLQAEYIAVDQLETNSLISSQTVNGRPAFAFRENGTFELNASSANGRTIQDGDGYRVYDGSGQVRVKIGNLSV